MAVAIYFHPPTLNEEQYRSVVDQLANDGAWPPAGLVHHFCFGERDSLMVYEVWKPTTRSTRSGKGSCQSWVDPGQSQVMPVINVLP